MQNFASPLFIMYLCIIIFWNLKVMEIENKIASAVAAAINHLYGATIAEK